MIRFRRLHRVGTLVGLILVVPLAKSPALALDVGYRCEATPAAVFRLATQTAQAMPAWRSVRILHTQWTIKAVVRNWRNLGVPMWIQVHPAAESTSNGQSELHLLWEQSMEPLNAPDLNTFVAVFGREQRALGLGCSWTGTEIGP
jgi:hypothetical protein